MSNLNSPDEQHESDLNSTELSVYLKCGVIALIILLIDFVTPLGVANGVPYVIVVLVSLKSPEKRFTIFIAAVCSLLVGVGYLGSPSSEIPMYQVFANRFLALFVIWVTAIMALKQRDKTAELHHDRLKYLQSIREVEVREEKLKVLKATMRTVQDITGNFLNNLHFFKLEIERNKTLTAESVTKLDDLINDTAVRLNKLGNLDEIREKKMAGDTIGIDYEHSAVNDDTIIK
ncbi:MAG: hypothetical protein EBU46_02035 [Nitrosomonadaceae bacterium]|nr:hypothetical protein [Nitrosomonadaceae bacterium]